MLRRRFTTLWQLSRHMGPAWVLFRLQYAWRLRSGMLRRVLPLCRWDDVPLEKALRAERAQQPRHELITEFRQQLAQNSELPGTFPADATAHFADWDTACPQASPVLEADRALQGEFTFFGGTVRNLGMPPQWHQNPMSGDVAPSDRHWSDLGDFGFGDIKFIWEPSRFSFVYSLVRAYARTGDERYAEAFWALTESWRRENPPQAGVNWKCGQEIAVRCLAWCFGLKAFLNSSATTDVRIGQLLEMLALSGKRIAANIDYAVSQQNNHGISEAAGLWTLGCLLPFLEAAENWRATGRQLLNQLATDLFYEDGAFSQHSFNYQRVGLHAYLWSLRVGDATGHSLESRLKQLVAKSGEFLHALQDETSGRLPRYGANDGALILPLNSCDPADYRPLIQACGVIGEGRCFYEPGPWNEDLLWLGEGLPQERCATETPREDVSTSSGYHTMRSENGLLFTRTARFRHRPSHADLLHVDLWWKGHNVAQDAGTYSYNARDIGDGSLGRTFVHNAVTVDGAEQMERASRFLWLPWARATMRQRSRHESLPLACWEGRHDGFRRLSAPVETGRAIVRVGSEHWLVLDRLTSREAHRYRLHWLLIDWPWETFETTADTCVLQAPIAEETYRLEVGTTSSARFAMERGTAESDVGWCAPHYGTKAACPAVTAELEADSALFWTLLGPADPASSSPSRIQRTGDILTCAVDGATVTLELTQNSDFPMVRAATMTRDDGEHGVLDLSAASNVA